MVLSLWRDNVCAASFRLAVDEVPELIEMLRAGLDRAYRHAPHRLPESVCGPDRPSRAQARRRIARRAGRPNLRNPLDGPIPS